MITVNGCECVTTVEAAALLGYSRRGGRILQLVRQGQLKGVRIGQLVLIERSSIDGFVRPQRGWPRGRKRGPRKFQSG